MNRLALIHTGDHQNKSPSPDFVQVTYQVERRGKSDINTSIEPFQFHDSASWSASTRESDMKGDLSER